MATDATSHFEEMIETVSDENVEKIRTMPKLLYNRPLGTVKVPDDLKLEEYLNRDETYVPTMMQKAMEDPDNFGNQDRAIHAFLTHVTEMEKRNGTLRKS